MAHTPGPWFARNQRSNQGHDCGWIIEDKGTGRIGWSSRATEKSDLAGFNTSDDELVEQEANARLIAAAPELLAALKAVVANHCGNEKMFCSTCSPAREVIAKAEGLKS